MRDPIVGDLFAGLGGASYGIEQALGRPSDFAVNHDPAAIRAHAANHPGTEHLLTDVHDVRPKSLLKGRDMLALWLSPDCTHFSVAKGGKPRDAGIRSLAWEAVRWAREAKPDVIFLENVREFQTWGPLGPEGFPIKALAGTTFAEWRAALEAEGYETEFRLLRADAYGAPTIRRRLFMVARRDGKAIRWPDPTHGDGPGFLPLKSAGEHVIDLSIPTPSIFERDEEYAEATMRRIAAGMRAFVLGESGPSFLIHVGNGEAPGQAPRVMSVDEPLTTVVAGGVKHRLVVPFIQNLTHGGRGESAAGPLYTVTGAHRGEKALIAPVIVRQNFDGQGKPADSLGDPLSTVTTQHNKHMLVAAFMAKHFGGHETPGSSLVDPLHTITAKDHNGLVLSHLVHMKGTGGARSAMKPLPAVMARGNHIAEVRWLMQYHHGGGQIASMNDPLHAVTTKDRIALGVCWIAGEPWQVVDIGYRMLTPRELARAQGFPEEYVIDPVHDYVYKNGRTKQQHLTLTDQVRLVGNSVCPPVARALVEANIGKNGQQHFWQGHELAVAS